MSDALFEFGLVGAGAISAGAYTSGVIDFIVQALDTWYAAKQDLKPDIPPHDVRFSVFSGASAGGMTAALTSAFLASDQPPISDISVAQTQGEKNTLFNSWVNRIDFSELLKTEDLRKKASTVSSLLDSTILEEIATTGLNVIPRQSKRAYLPDEFELFLTVTNLRGVPYSFLLRGTQMTKYSMSLHADYEHFQFSYLPGPAAANDHGMTWEDFGNPHHQAKQQLVKAALATGAFPVGLAPRILSQAISATHDPYSERKWPIPTPQSKNPHKCVRWEPIPTGWGNIGSNYQYQYACVDGGVMNNEPFELARQSLAGADLYNKRNADDADKAVILIDPFPNETKFDPKYDEKPPDLFTMLKALLTSLQNQVRFKPDELKLAEDPNVFSRFMIAPSRYGSPFPIACGSLAGFGGFLKRDFRLHDFFLGRRNAQKFLKDHFALSETNKVFSNWPQGNGMRSRYCIRDAQGMPILLNGMRLLPIIPLVGSAAIECPILEWPVYTDPDLRTLTGQIEVRLDTVADRLVKQYFDTNNFFVRCIANWVLRGKKKDLRKYAIKMIINDLKLRNLCPQSLGD